MELCGLSNAIPLEMFKRASGLLRRCSTEAFLGITTLDVINEVAHRLMLAEAGAKHVIAEEQSLGYKLKDAAKLRGKTLVR